MILALIGLVLYFIGAIGLMIDEFKENVIWGLFGLFTQVAHIIFALIHFDKCKKSLGYMLLGIVLIILGLALSAPH
mgnify:CR=1 FL=1|jgi:uncharacterized membrane protein